MPFFGLNISEFSVISFTQVCSAAAGREQKSFCAKFRSAKQNAHCSANQNYTIRARIDQAITPDELRAKGIRRAGKNVAGSAKGCSVFPGREDKPSGRGRDAYRGGAFSASTECPENHGSSSLRPLPALRCCRSRKPCIAGNEATWVFDRLVSCSVMERTSKRSVSANRARTGRLGSACGSSRILDP